MFESLPKHLILLLTKKQYVRPRGTVVAIGLPAGAYLRAPVFESVIKMITIKGSYVGNRSDSAEAIEFFRRGLIKAPYKTCGLSELQKVYGMYILSFKSHHPEPHSQCLATREKLNANVHEVLGH